MIGIYKITSPSNKIYIGQSWDVKARIAKYKRENAPKQASLHCSFLKYGALNHSFEIVQTLPEDVTQSTLDNLEIFCISQYKEGGFSMMNIKDGGSRGKHSEATKIKLSVSQKGIRKGNSGSFKKGEHKYTLTAEQRLKISIANKGRKRSPENIAKTVALHTGNKYAVGRIWSQASKDKMSKSKKGTKATEDQKKKRSEFTKIWWAKRKGGNQF